jgi:hypothetical protein
VSLHQVDAPRATGRIALLVVSVFVLGVALTWAFLSMRVVMEVGGSCADGGPYVSAQPCPGGAGFVGLAIPLMLIAAFAGSFAGASLGTPNLIVPMWFFLFGTLGWNFLAYGATADGGPVWGWIICGVVFEAMALPALYVMGFRADQARWWLAYAGLAAAGVLVGTLTFNALT